MSALRSGIGRVSRRWGLLLSAAVNAATLMIGLLTGVITARGFEPDERGVLVAIVLWANTISSFSLVGLDQALVFGAGGDPRRAQTLGGALRRRVKAQSAVGAAASFVAGLFLARDFGTQAWLLAGVGTLPVVSNGLTQLRLAPILIADRYVAWNAARLASPLTYAAILGGLFLTDRLSLVPALAAVGLGSAASLLIAMLVTDAHQVVNSSQEPDHLVRYGRQMLLITVPAFLASRVDQLLMGLLVSPATLGVYAIGVSVASVLEIPKLTIEQLAFPHFVRVGWGRRSVRLRGFAVTALTSILGGCLYLAARPLIPLIYGHGYRPALDPLPWLLLAASLRVGNAYMGTAARAGGQLRMIARSQAIALTSTSLVLVATLPVWGAQGAALAVFIGQLAYFMLMFRNLDPVGLPPSATADA